MQAATLRDHIRVQIGFLQEQQKLIALQISRLAQLDATLNPVLATTTTNLPASSSSNQLEAISLPSSTVVSNPDDFSSSSSSPGLAIGNGSITNLPLPTLPIPMPMPMVTSNYELLKEQLKNEKKVEKARMKAEKKMASKALKKMEKKLTKREVDPNKPKKPLTAYLLFSNAEMPKLRAEMAQSSIEYTHKDMMVRLGAKWKQLTPEERKFYDDQVEPDITAYHNKLEEYRDRGGKGALGSTPLPPAPLPIEHSAPESMAVQFILTKDKNLEADDEDDTEGKKKKKKKTRDDDFEMDLADDGQEEDGTGEQKKRKKKKHNKEREDEDE